MTKTSILRNNTPFIVLAIALLLLSFVPFIMRGMSADGVLYSGFAYNLAHGISSLWSPFLNPTHWPTFHAHPPLSFYIHSLFLTCLGDDAFVDKIYFFSTVLANLSLVLLFWRTCHRELNLSFLWIPVLYWVMILENTLEAYRGNIDATLMVFTTLGVYLLFKACSKEKRSYCYFILGIFSIIAAFFINGCQVFFLLTVPLIYHCTDRKGSLWLGIKQTVLLGCITCAGIFIFLYTNESAWKHMHLYLFDKVLHGSLMADSEHFLTARFLIFWVILKNIAPALLCSVICLLIYRRQLHRPILPLLKKLLVNRRACFFFLAALSASLPVIVSPHQTSRYIVASFPLWTLCFSELLTPLYVDYIQHLDAHPKTYLLFRNFSIIVFGFVLVFGYFCAGKVIFGKPVVEDIALLQKIIPPKIEISMNDATLDDRWSYFLRLSLYRYMHITSYGALDKPFFLQGKQVITHPEGYKLINIPFQTFALYERVPQ